MKNYLEKFNKITSVFTKTLEDLNKLNTEIEVEYNQNQDSINRLTERNVSLQSNKEIIGRFMGNLSTLINGNNG